MRLAQASPKLELKLKQSRGCASLSNRKLLNLHSLCLTKCFSKAESIYIQQTPWALVHEPLDITPPTPTTFPFFKHKHLC